jgi:hypothetical protein
MTAQDIPEAGRNTFDGEAISRADREFLTGLSDHPLVRHPLYAVPCPPPPDVDQLRPEENVETAREAAFAAAVDWMLVNYAYREGAFMSKGGAVSLVDGEIIALMDLRGRMGPWDLMEVGPRGGIKMRSPVNDWLRARTRLSVRREEMRSDRPRPTFFEDGYHIFNRYRPPTHPTTGGDTAALHAFLEHLLPHAEERKWYWSYLAHKARRPWVPMIAVFMVAEEFGSGRGTLFDILELLFGKDYVVPCTFGELTGRAAGARFNARMADALFVLVNEAVAEDGHQQAQRRLDYEALKNVIEPSPTARRRFEAKGQHAYAQTCAASIHAATNHRDVVKLPWDDRRICVLTCGGRMTEEQTTKIRVWMADSANIGALYRELLNAPAVPTSGFNPFDYPPAFRGRREMIGMARSRLEDAYDAMIEALEGCPLFTMTQAQKLIGYIGAHSGGGDWSDRARYTVAKNAYRLREKGEPDNRIKYRKRQEIIYARTRAEQQKWRATDTKVIIATIDRTEERVTQVINAERDVLADLMKQRADDSDSAPPEGDA